MSLNKANLQLPLVEAMSLAITTDHLLPNVVPRVSLDPNDSLFRGGIDPLEYSVDSAPIISQYSLLGKYQVKGLALEATTPNAVANIAGAESYATYRPDPSIRYSGSSPFHSAGVLRFASSGQNGNQIMLHSSAEFKQRPVDLNDFTEKNSGRSTLVTTKYSAFESVHVDGIHKIQPKVIASTNEDRSAYVYREAADGSYYSHEFVNSNRASELIASLSRKAIFGDTKNVINRILGN